MSVHPVLLFVDDEDDNVELFRLHFGEEFTIRSAKSGAEALQILEREDIGLIITDERMPGMTGIEMLARIVERWPDTVRIIVSAYGDASRLLSAMNRGHAHEYMLKPWDDQELRGCLLRGQAMVERRRRLAAHAEVGEVLAADLRREHDPSHIVGGDAGLKPTLDLARRAAQSDATVLLHGETGSGKELVAHFIHEASPRRNQPFIRVNCGALSEGLLESELFGHERGAFTGAERTRRGRFELADGGTLFIDEIGDISAKLQVTLLRVLQERELERVGGNATIHVDVRVIAATHQDLPQLVAQGHFREDLYYRLNVLPVRIPPLRERVDDLPALLGHFIAKHASRRWPAPELGAGVVAALSSYSWPGNVRELENLVQRALVLAQGSELGVDDFSLQLARPGAEPIVAARPREQAQKNEAEQLRELLLFHGGNCTRAAVALGVPRTTFISRAKKYDLL